MYTRQENEYYRAKMKAARKICRGWVKPSDLPSNREIRDEIRRFTAELLDSRLGHMLDSLQRIWLRRSGNRDLHGDMLKPSAGRSQAKSLRLTKPGRRIPNVSEQRYEQRTYKNRTPRFRSSHSFVLTPRRPLRVSE